MSPSTVGRWLAEAGLLGADPEIDPARLRELYEERGLTTREIAAELGRSKTMVIRALAAAGIPAVPERSGGPAGPGPR